ncbi:MAG TPA: hypothetical protein VHG10_06435 [Glycomyces sp.]|nr:hypothetical protein [Glycomyces sp.]
MNAVLAQRKYRIAGRLANDTAWTFGLFSAVAFLVLAAGSVAYRLVTGEQEEFALWLLFAIPLMMTVLGWVHLTKSYPLALANGLTRKEFLAGFAMFGLATVLATAALTQLAVLILDHAPANGSAHTMGFYGIAPFESLARPALYFTAGAAAGAAMLRIRNRWFGALIGALMVAAVVYRQLGYMFGVRLIESEGTPIFDEMSDMAAYDAVLAVLFVLAAWALLARAPMRPKPA